MKFYMLTHVKYFDGSSRWWLTMLTTEETQVHNIYITRKEASKILKFLPVIEKEPLGKYGNTYTYYKPEVLIPTV